MANIRILVVVDKSMSDVDDDIGVAHLPGGSISDYETLCGACNTARVYKDTVAARRKERAESAIRGSPKKLFADHVEVTCFEYERPKVAQRSRR